MTPLIGRQDRIRERLVAAFSPTELLIEDTSHQHRNHAAMLKEANDPLIAETHLTITMISPHLEGVPRIAKHRMVNDLLKDEFEKGLHALSLRL